MPVGICPQLPQHEHCKRGRADAVDVVVAVNADAPARGDGAADPLDRLGHLAEQERIVQRLLAGQEGPRLVGIAVAAPDEHACRDLAEAELRCEGARLPVRARTYRPDALLHRRPTLRTASDDVLCALLSTAARGRILGRPCWIPWPRARGGGGSCTSSASSHWRRPRRSASSTRC